MRRKALQAPIARREFLARLPAATTVAALARPHGVLSAERPPPSKRFDVREFGARGDGEALDTAVLQKAIDACAHAGGGTVHFPPGRYLSGTLFLKSRITLDFDSAAVLLGSRRLEDYPPTVSPIRSYTDNYTERCLIYGEHLESVTLQGRGVIDGQGAAFKGPYKVRPYLIRMIDCRDGVVRDLTLKDSPMWVQHYLACDRLRIEGLTVLSKCNANNDGIDIDGCHRVRIANCDIQSGDDAIVLKSTLDRSCQDVVITNCILSSDANAFKLGTESNGGFENIVLSNCAMYDTRSAGIAVESVDGGALDGVSVSNITMRNVRCPIFIRLGNRARPFQKDMERPGMGSLRNVSISGVQAVGANFTGCCLAGLSEHPVENVTLSNIRLSFSGGGKQGDVRRPLPEKPEAYPEYSMFGLLPAYGLYCRHARNLILRDIEVSVATSDERPSLWCEDVGSLQLSGWQAGSRGKNNPVVRFEDVEDALISGCHGPQTSGAYLRVDGKRSARILLTGNELDQAGESVELGPEVPPGAVRIGRSDGR